MSVDRKILEADLPEKIGKARKMVILLEYEKNGDGELILWPINRSTLSWAQWAIEFGIMRFDIEEN
jgi:hypothetical protein